MYVHEILPWCLHGASLDFGRTSAVVSSNRLPTFVVAAVSRMTCVLARAFFDDLDRVIGAPSAPDKCIPPVAVRTYLGASVDVSSVQREGIVRFGPKLTPVKKVLIMVQSALDTQQLTPGSASKLRDCLVRATSHSFGKVARIGIRALKSRQYDFADTMFLSRVLESALLHILEILSVLRPYCT